MVRDKQFNLDYLNLGECNNIFRNLSVSELVEKAICRHEGVLTSNGALSIETGKYTGRSPKDRFIIRQKATDDIINWGNANIPTDEETFENLFEKVTKYLQSKDIYVFDGFVGADKKYTLPIRVVCENASQALFSNQLFRRPKVTELEGFKPGFTIIAAPGFKADAQKDNVNSEAFIIINFDKKIVLIGGTGYCGEIKKSVFSVMNFLLPSKGVMPMHCSANIGKNGKSTIFFGLSGTGKTTLSTEIERRLIGDDEHGWSDNGVFNFEGGCYAKVINLDKEKETEIYDAIKFGTVIENVILDEKRNPKYNDVSLTQNTRAAYPIDYIENSTAEGMGASPNTIIFLTADAFGVIPPISRLTKESAMYHFMSGYTSKVAGTERGIKEPKATFSSCFGEPFMLMNPRVYAEILGDRIEKHETNVYMINTGWLYGGYGKGSRIKLAYTRAMVHAAIEGKFKNVSFEMHPVFKMMVPLTCPDVPAELLNPRNTWEDKEAYDIAANDLAKRFEENFKKFVNIPRQIISAGPVAIDHQRV
jgi:phosphoenolpyruvate carboxykinase (ATP)